MEDKNEQLEDDMSKTFIAEVGQKSAIADDNVEQLEENDNSPVFPEVKIDPPNEELDVKPQINTNELGTNLEEDTETIPGYEKESSMYEEPKKKKNPVFIIILVILSLAIGAGGSYYYFEVFNKEDTSTKTEEKEEVKKDTIEELNVNGLFVQNLIEDYDYSLIGNISIYDELYANEKTNVSDIDEYYLRNLAAMKARRSLGNAGFSGESFTKAVETLFGGEIILENKSFTDNETDEGGCYAYKYDQKEDYYDFKEPIGCGGRGILSLERKIVKAVKKENTLEINVAIAIKNTEEDKVYKNYVTNPDGTDASQVIEGVTATAFDIDKDYAKLNQYQYNFKYDTENANYYLESIELVK